MWLDQLDNEEEKQKFQWDSIQKMLFGVTDREVELLDDEATEELAKEVAEITKGDKFPSLTKAMFLNQKRTADYIDELESNFGDGEE